ncbi:hypothetical protein [Paenibacillus sp. NPDC057934]|uniref:hypothetical protein n=1 Tax=Paenibacillus sp. NPDC057934 TaxID=3346282 RepID=UPI0036DD9580
MDYLRFSDGNRSPTGLLVASTDDKRHRLINSNYEIFFIVSMTSVDYKEKIILKGP